MASSSDLSLGELKSAAQGHSRPSPPNEEDQDAGWDTSSNMGNASRATSSKSNRPAATSTQIAAPSMAGTKTV